MVKFNVAIVEPRVRFPARRRMARCSSVGRAVDCSGLRNHQLVTGSIPVSETTFPFCHPVVSPCRKLEVQIGAIVCGATIDRYAQRTIKPRTIVYGPMDSDFCACDGRSQTIAPICGCEKCDIVTNSRLARSRPTSTFPDDTHK